MIEIHAIWSLVTSHKNCCILFPLSAVRYVFMLDILEAIVIAWVIWIA